MKTNHTIFLILLGLLTLTQGCSRKKETFISRNYHALTTRDNILFNGRASLAKGQTTINNQYSENFWELLPVERMQVVDVIKFDDTQRNPDFQIAEDKAAKAIGKHSMNIQGKERNPQMDEAYLLLGKARYYDQRFVPALSAFNYIMNKYPTSDKINLVKIWREKTNMRLDNSEITIKKLKQLLFEEDLKDKYKAEATATLAQAYLNLKHKDSAKMYLDSALVYTRVKDNKARYHFIKGQLYNDFGHKDSANAEFNAIIEMHRKIPRAYYINAHLQKSFNYNSEVGDKIAFLEYLTDLEENRENRPFLDKIYYRIAEFHLEQGKDSLAEVYYNKSLKAVKSDNQLKIFNYQTLGDMRFDIYEFKEAGAYYDSTLSLMEKKTKPYRALEKKRRSLDDVIYYEDLAKINDSILHLVHLPDEERLAYFTEFTEKLKKEAIEKEKQRLEEQKKQQALANISISQNNDNNSSLNPNRSGFIDSNAPGDALNPTASKFYFYNSNLVAFGKNQFTNLWGNRKLTDNWRLSTQVKSIENDTTDTKDVLAVIENDESFKPEFYINKIPTDPEEIESISKERNFAYYQLGGIYKEKFKELKLAKTKFEKLLKQDPEERLILPSKYNLYKIYIELGETLSAEKMKSDIIDNHSDSRYAEILRNPDLQLDEDENDPEVIYNKLYKRYKNQDYSNVISEIENQVKKFEGDPMVPKYEMLKASAKGRLYGFETYKKGVNFVALNYPNSDEGKKAELILRESIPALAKKEFVKDGDAKHFNVIYQFQNSTFEEIDTFYKLLIEEIEKIKYLDVTASKDVYDENTTFVVVHGIKSSGLADSFNDIIYEEERDEKGRLLPRKINKPFIPISSPNYAVVQRHKNLNAYLKLQ